MEEHVALPLGVIGGQFAHDVHESAADPPVARRADDGDREREVRRRRRRAATSTSNSRIAAPSPSREADDPGVEDERIAGAVAPVRRPAPPRIGARSSTRPHATGVRARRGPHLEVRAEELREPREVARARRPRRARRGRRRRRYASRLFREQRRAGVGVGKQARRASRTCVMRPRFHHAECGRPAAASPAGARRGASSGSARARAGAGSTPGWRPRRAGRSARRAGESGSPAGTRGPARCAATVRPRDRAPRTPRPSIGLVPPRQAIDHGPRRPPRRPPRELSAHPPARTASRRRRRCRRRSPRSARPPGTRWRRGAEPRRAGHLRRSVSSRRICPRSGSYRRAMSLSERRLAGSVRPDQRHDLPSPERERDPGQRRRARAGVGEPHVLDPEVAALRRGHRAVAGHDVRLQLEERHELLDGERLLEYVVQGADGAIERCAEPRGRRREDGNVPDSRGPGGHPQGQAHEDRVQADRRQQREARASDEVARAGRPGARPAARARSVAGPLEEEGREAEQTDLGARPAGPGAPRRSSGSTGASRAARSSGRASPSCGDTRRGRRARPGARRTRSTSGSTCVRTSGQEHRLRRAGDADLQLRDEARQDRRRVVLRPIDDLPVLGVVQGGDVERGAVLEHAASSWRGRGHR